MKIREDPSHLQPLLCHSRYQRLPIVQNLRLSQLSKIKQLFFRLQPTIEPQDQLLAKKISQIKIPNHLKSKATHLNIRATGHRF
jgi:hypothetical protein